MQPMPPVDTWTDWPLQQNAIRQFVRRKARGKTLIHPAFDATRSIFVHVPRVAGTSVKKSLFPDAWITHYRAVDYFLDSPLRYLRYFVFAFVRNPYDRLISAYEQIRRGGTNETTRRFRDRVLCDYPTFADLVRHGLGRRKEIGRAYHFMPQHRFLVGPTGSIIVDYLGRFENIEADFATVAERTGVHAILPHRNASTRSRLDQYYTDELRAIVYKHYRRDFELLGYDPSLPSEA